MKMRGRIFKLNGKAKIEVWNETWEIGKNIDGGGYCNICKRSFNTIGELISHFMNEHEGGR